jgi:hypothetical protein
MQVKTPSHFGDEIMYDVVMLGRAERRPVFTPPVMEEVASSHIPIEMQSYARMEPVDVSVRNMWEGAASQIV